MGWTSCETKQRKSCTRLLCKLYRLDETRMLSKIWKYSARRRKRWTFMVDMDLLVQDTTLSTKLVMKIANEKLSELDNQEWQKDIFNDKANEINGNKLRTYRLYKNNVSVGPYVRQNLTSSQRRLMAMFRAGSLPLALETGRYSRPPVPVQNRLCQFCSLSEVETEKHFLMTCDLYSDLRFEIFYEASKHIANFQNISMDEKLIEIMNCDTIQQLLCKQLHKFFTRRKLYLDI